MLPLQKCSPCVIELSCLYMKIYANIQCSNGYVSNKNANWDMYPNTHVQNNKASIDKGRNET